LLELSFNIKYGYGKGVKEIVLPLLVAALILAIKITFVKLWPALGDASYYYAMAKDPFIFISPEGLYWRPLWPLNPYSFACIRSPR
jgi:hypothetical protein